MIRVRYIIDYSEQPFGTVDATIKEDRETLSEYGAVVDTQRSGTGEAIYAYTVQFETEDGWEAYEQAHETLGRLTLDNSTLERIKE